MYGLGNVDTFEGETVQPDPIAPDHVEGAFRLCGVQGSRSRQGRYRRLRGRAGKLEDTAQTSDGACTCWLVPRL